MAGESVLSGLGKQKIFDGLKIRDSIRRLQPCSYIDVDLILPQRQSLGGMTMIAEAIKGFQTVTPYLTAIEAEALIEFVKKAFDGQEIFRGTGSAGGIHCEIRINDSTMMIGGGGAWKGPAMPGAIHLYVNDVDAVYQRSLEFGATPLMPPTDQEYGDRDSAVRDLAGNHWYIATHKGTTAVPQGMRSVTPYLHPKGAADLIGFMQKAFGAKELDVHHSPQGTVDHAKLSIGDSTIEVGEAHGQWQAMPMTLFLYVDHVDDLYAQALRAGAASVSEPADQAWGARSAGVKDPHENVWYIATPIKQ